MDDGMSMLDALDTGVRKQLVRSPPELLRNPLAGGFQLPHVLQGFPLDQPIAARTTRRVVVSIELSCAHGICIDRR